MKTLLLLLLFTALDALGQPAQIILFRHAEEPYDPAAVNLSPRGVERARALVSLFGKASTLTSNAPVAVLYATHVTKRGRSHRSGETLAPLSKELGLPVQTPYESELYSLLARDILSNRAYRGKTVIICWTHDDIAALAAALGVNPAPSPWKGKVFDRLWLIKLRGRDVEFQDLPQHLLKGDSER
jgi:hypothetical protein